MKRPNRQRKIGGIIVCAAIISIICILNKKDDKPINILNHMENGMDDPVMTAYYQQEISDVEELTNGTMSSGNLSSWEGTYHFDEFYRDPSDPDGPFLAMDYDLRIYPENGKYFAEVEIEGQTTWIHVLAQVHGNEEGIDFVYLKGLEEDPFTRMETEPGTVLLSLKKEDGLIYTYWGAITAYIYNSNQRSGRVYFTKMEEPETNPNDSKILSVMGASLEIPCWNLEELRMNDSGLLSRWSQDEVDTVLNALEGYWIADEYAGFVLPEFYFSHLAETDCLSDENRMQVYEEKIDEARNHIPEWHFSIRQNNTGDDTEKNCVYIDGQEEQEIDLFLCMSREEDHYPEYVERTAVSRDIDVTYPVLYMEFKVPEDGAEKQVNLIITAEDKMYLLTDGAFYTVKKI